MDVGEVLLAEEGEEVDVEGGVGEDVEEALDTLQKPR